MLYTLMFKSVLINNIAYLRWATHSFTHMVKDSFSYRGINENCNVSNYHQLLKPPSLTKDDGHNGCLC